MRAFRIDLRKLFVLIINSIVLPDLWKSAEPRPSTDAANVAQSVAVTVSSTLSLSDFVNSAAAGIGARAVACPAPLVASMKQGLEEQGGTFLGAGCWLVDAKQEDVQTRLDSIQTKLAPDAKKRKWKARPDGGSKQVVNYGKEGVGWWVLPAGSGPPDLASGKSTVVIAQMMR